MDETKPLVSVIVPIYNVEQYLRECIDSIIRQTYKNLEIILVDDGSPDNCGKIAETYAEKDNRIKVLHKENGGLSDARNVGITEAKGEYISLIDSDDYISEFFIEIMMKNAMKYDADVITTGQSEQFFDESKERPELAKSADDFKSRCISVKEALVDMSYQVIPNGAQFRIYRRYIFDHIKYPKGYIFEDVATTYKTFIAARKMCLVDAKIYAYRVRQNSIVRKKFSQDKMVAIPITRRMYHDLVAYDSSLRPAAASRAFAQNFHVFLQVPEEDKDSMKKLWHEVIKYRRLVAADRDKRVRKKNKIGAFVTYLGMMPAYEIGNRFGKSSLMRKQ